VTVGSEIGNIQKEKCTSAAAAGLAAKYQSTFTLNEAARKSICANAFGRGLSLPKMQSGAHGLRNQRHSRRLNWGLARQANQRVTMLHFLEDCYVEFLRNTGRLRFFVLIIDGMSIGQHAPMQDARN
jgi:hypothetical protein